MCILFPGILIYGIQPPGDSYVLELLLIVCLGAVMII